MMIRFLLLMTTATLFGIAGEPGTQGKSNAPPAGAVETAPGMYRHKDAKGKTWNYRRTPFGYVKTSAAPVKEAPEPSEPREKTPFSGSKAAPDSEPAAKVEAQEVKAVEDGDNIRFERQTPFGKVRWTRAKKDLLAAEQQAWDRARESIREKQ